MFCNLYQGQVARQAFVPKSSSLRNKVQSVSQSVSLHVIPFSHYFFVQSRSLRGRKPFNCDLRVLYLFVALLNLLKRQRMPKIRTLFYIVDVKKRFFFNLLCV